MEKLSTHLQHKRNEFIYALSLQPYSHAEIAKIFGLNRSTVMRIIRDKPKVRWVKVV